MRIHKEVWLFFLLATHNFLHAQTKTDTLLKQVLIFNNNNLFREVILQPHVYRLQIIYTQINRDAHKHPSFKNYYYNYNSQTYFNPASMVKLPLAFLSLEKINELNINGVNKYTTILFDSSQSWQRPMLADTTAVNGLPSIAHFIKRALLISENDPYNRMYQFVGQQSINQKLHQKSYGDVRITRQFLGLTFEQNRYSNPLRFVNATRKLLYKSPPAFNTDSFNFKNVIKIGKAHINRNDSLVNEPFDFTMHNSLSLEDMQQMLQSVLFPQSVAATKRFNLTKDDYKFLYRYLSQYPSETPSPKYDTAKFYDSYVKFFFRDSTHKMPRHLRVFNKVGWSYGFLTDVSYVVDFKNKVEFMLSATLYVNSDGIVNDGKYDYDKIGYPFLYQLGQTIYQFELKRKKTFEPDLSPFKIKYDIRNANDKRPALHDVDN
ncbi:MAG: serine hydrolase [Bacteroidota bacterium]